MNVNNPSPRDDLSEPLRSIVDDLANEPVPEELIAAARRVARLDQQDGRGPISRHALRLVQGRTTQATPRQVASQRSVFAVMISLSALGLFLAALIIREKPSEPERDIAQEIEPAPMEQSEELPPPSLWAYRQAARSPEALEELLTHHAAVLLPGRETVSLSPFARKEEL